jgi:hypothetical protein
MQFLRSKPVQPRSASILKCSTVSSSRRPSTLVLRRRVVADSAQMSNVSPVHTKSPVAMLQDGEQEAEKEAAAKTYEKDDFFDSLSCEALDRLAIREAGEDARVDGRARNAAQRKVPVLLVPCLLDSLGPGCSLDIKMCCNIAQHTSCLPQCHAASRCCGFRAALPAGVAGCQVQRGQLVCAAAAQLQSPTQPSADSQEDGCVGRLACACCSAYVTSRLRLQWTLDLASKQLPLRQASANAAGCS